MRLRDFRQSVLPVCILSLLASASTGLAQDTQNLETHAGYIPAISGELDTFITSTVASQALSHRSTPPY